MLFSGLEKKTQTQNRESNKELLFYGSSIMLIFRNKRLNKCSQVQKLRLAFEMRYVALAIIEFFCYKETAFFHFIIIYTGCVAIDSKLTVITLINLSTRHVDNYHVKYKQLYI